MQRSRKLGLLILFLCIFMCGCAKNKGSYPFQQSTEKIVQIDLQINKNTFDPNSTFETVKTIPHDNLENFIDELLEIEFQEAWNDPAGVGGEIAIVCSLCLLWHNVN